MNTDQDVILPNPEQLLKDVLACIEENADDPEMLAEQMDFIAQDIRAVTEARDGTH